MDLAAANPAGWSSVVVGSAEAGSLRVGTLGPVSLDPVAD